MRIQFLLFSYFILNVVKIPNVQTSLLVSIQCVPMCTQQSLCYVVTSAWKLFTKKYFPAWLYISCQISFIPFSRKSTVPIFANKSHQHWRKNSKNNCLLSKDYFFRYPKKSKLQYQ